jgi:HEAT repeat protein
MKSSQLCMLIGVVLLQITIASVCAQDATFGRLPAPKTLGEALHSRGVSDLSEESLSAELNNSDPEVRNLAANKLAEDHVDRAAPAIESALSHEQNVATQIGFAEALWVLHDQKGVAHLQRMCMDSGLSLPDLMSAIRALHLIRSTTGVCAETFLASMTHPADAGQLGMALSLLPPLYGDATAEQAKQIVYKLRTLLLDRSQQTIVRIMSSKALAQISTPDSVNALREAISLEQDPNTRSAFENDLKAIESQK